MLIREADLLIDADDGDALKCHPEKPAWVYESERKDFAPKGFNGDPSTLEDADFESIREPLDDPESTLDAVGAAAKQKTSAKRWYEHLEESVLVLSLVPVTVVAFADLFIWQPTLAGIVEQATILIAFTFSLILWRTSLKTHWTEARTIREIWRSLDHSLNAVDPIHPVQAHYFPRHSGLIRTLIFHQQAIAEADHNTAIDKLRKTYIEQRIEKQKNYFDSRRTKASRLHRRLKLGFLIAAILSAICAVVTLLNHLLVFGSDHADTIERIFQDFGAMLFPAVAAAFLGIIGLSGTSRRIGFYKIMLQRLAIIRREFDAANDLPTIESLISETESILLEEIADWARRNEF